MSKFRGVLSLALLLSARALAASVLVVFADETSRNFQDDVTEFLAGSKTLVKVAGLKAPATSCLTVPRAQRQDCFATAGGAANVESILLMSSVAQGRALIVTFEVLLATDGRPLRREMLRTTVGRFKSQAASVVKRLVAPKRKAEVVAQTQRPPEAEVTPPLEPARPVSLVDRPEIRTLEPRPIDAPPQLVTQPMRPAPSPVGAWVATGGAVVAAGIGATFGALGFANHARLQRTTFGVSPLSYSQAQALQNTTNLQLTIALSAAIAAGVSGGLAAILWSTR